MSASACTRLCLVIASYLTKPLPAVISSPRSAYWPRFAALNSPFLHYRP